MPSTDFSDIFLTDFQPLENVLGLIQNLNQNLVAELAPLGLGDLAFLELFELDRVFVCHGVTLVDAAFSVYFFFRLFSDFNHHPVVVAEVASAVAALCKRREVVRLHLNHLADVRHCFGLGLTAREVHRSVGLAILHRNEGHAAELVYLDDLDVVLHGQTMVENSVTVNSFRYFFSLFFQISF